MQNDFIFRISKVLLTKDLDRLKLDESRID